MTDPTMIAKVEALLAKAERTDNKHEAEAYFEKAQQLMSKYAIAEAMLSQARGESHEIVTDTINVGTDQSVIQIFKVVAEANNCSCFRSMGWYVDKNDKYRRRTSHIVIYGTRSDIEFTKLLFASLLMHCQRSLATMRALMPEHFGGKSYGHSFRLGYAESVGDKLRAGKRAAAKESDEPGAELALFDKFAAADEKMRQENKLTRSVTRIRDADAYSSGYRHGQRADVSGGRNNLRGRCAIDA